VKSCTQTLLGSDLSPPEVVHVCRGERLSLSCVSNARFLEWNISAWNYIGLKLISSGGSTDPLTVNYTTFTFTRESQQPLNVTLTIVNATVDYRVVCQTVPAGATNPLEKTVRIIRANDIASIIIANYYDYSSVNIIVYLTDFYLEYLNETELPSMGLEQYFGENNVTMTVSLDLEREYNRSGIIYSILFTTSSALAVEQTERIIFSDNKSMQLTVSYNSQYNISVFSNLCGHELQSEIIQIFYGKCQLWYYYFNVCSMHA
jgi:hypothetical protein